MACVMFAGARKGLAFRLSDGQQVVVDGSVNVYERDGKYQLYATGIRLDGAGILYEKYLALKQELEEMGMFDPAYKKPIPSHVKKLGVVTAPTGAAIRDIINISRRRNPGIQIILYPAKVQGEGSAESVARGIEALNQTDVDVIIAGRGGGSIEDLWAFNEECVARAIFASEIPVISAVGHETDTTIADFVADLRAPTPSAAAELAVMDVSVLFQRMDSYRQQMNRGIRQQIEQLRMRTDKYAMKLQYASPEHQIREQRQRAASLEEQFRRIMEQKLQERRYRMSVYIEKMKAVSPLEKLAQGYAYVTGQEKKRIYSVEQVEAGEMLQLYVSDGYIDAEVKDRRKL